MINISSEKLPVNKLFKQDTVTSLIKQHWSSIGKVTSFGREIANHGSDNIIFSVEDGSNYIFRLVFFNSWRMFVGSQFYEYLYNKGIPTALPVKTDDGAYFIDAGDAYPDRDAAYTVHTYIEGEEGIDKTKLGDIIEELAMWLGKLHRSLMDLDLSTFDLGEVDANDLEKEYEAVSFKFDPSSPMSETIPDHPLVQEMYKIWNKWGEQLDETNLTKGLVHGDIGPGCNIMVKSRKVSGIIDLFGLNYGYYMEDVGSFVMYGGLLRAERLAWLEQFKQVYLHYAPISHEEMDLLPFFVLRRYLVQALYFGWRIRVGYEQGNTEEEDNDKGFQDALDMLNFWKSDFAGLYEEKRYL